VNRSLAALLLLPTIALAAPVPKAKEGVNKLLVATEDGKLTLLNPDGTDARTVLEAGEKQWVYNARLSPDGKQVMYCLRPVGDPSDGTPTTLHLLDLDTKKSAEVISIPHTPMHLFWAPDGKSVYGNSRDPSANPNPGRPADWSNWRIDVVTGRKTDLTLPAEYRAWGLGPKDGELIFLRHYLANVGGGRSVGRVDTVTSTVSEFDPKEVFPGALELYPLATFPDGKRWIVQWPPTKIGAFTVGDEKPTRWDKLPKYAGEAFAISPDGKRIAFQVLNRQVGNTDPATLWVCDADGTNAKQVWESKARGLAIDWR
jgi:hypothetical protein